METNRCHGYPRPHLGRPEWVCLNGRWDFALDHEACWSVQHKVIWDAAITVPYSPETFKSGIGDTGYYRACWYRRTFDSPSLKQGQRLLLHLGSRLCCVGGVESI